MPFGDILQVLQKEIDALSFALSNGQAKDFAEYKKITGRIEGLRQGISVVKSIEKRYARD